MVILQQDSSSTVFHPSPFKMRMSVLVFLKAPPAMVLVGILNTFVCQALPVPFSIPSPSHPPLGSHQPGFQPPAPVFLCQSAFLWPLMTTLAALVTSA